MAQKFAQQSGYKVPATEVLPETVFGYSCGFGRRDGLWTCNQPPQARSLLSKPFSMKHLVYAKDGDRFCDFGNVNFNKSSVLSVAVARTGSKTIKQILTMSGQPA